MSKNKHLTLQERLTIESELWRNSSFKKIGIILNKDCTSISKEVRKHITIKELAPKLNLLIIVFIEIIVIKKEYAKIIVFNLKIDFANIVKNVIAIVMNSLKKNVLD